MKEREEENAQEALRRLAQQQEDEAVAEQTRGMIEARLEQLRERQQQARVEQEAAPAPEPPQEQKPKVVHVKAAQAKPAKAVRTRQKVAQHDRG
jgi:hypothetical protein